MKRIVCFGEVLWDIIGEEKFLGGAPLNVAANLACMECEAMMFSCVGNDELGRAALARMDAAGVDSSLVTTAAGRPTGVAVVHPELDGDGRFDLPFPSAYDFIGFSENAEKSLEQKRPDGIVFGSLAPFRSGTTKKSLMRLLELCSGALKFYDVNLRKNYFDRALVSELASACTVLKLNADEVGILSPMLFGQTLGAADFAARAAEKFGCRYVVVTKGGDGAEGFGPDGAHVEVRTPKADVVDTVGAGDAFSAGFFSALLRGETLKSALEMGNACGAVCVSHSGAFPV